MFISFSNALVQLARTKDFRLGLNASRVVVHSGNKPYSEQVDWQVLRGIHHHNDACWNFARWLLLQHCIRGVFCSIFISHRSKVLTQQHGHVDLYRASLSHFGLLFWAISQEMNALSKIALDSGCWHFQIMQSTLEGSTTSSRLGSKSNWYLDCDQKAHSHSYRFSSNLKGIPSSVAIDFDSSSVDCTLIRTPLAVS